MANSSMSPAASGTGSQLLDVLTKQDVSAEVINTLCLVDAPWSDLTYSSSLDTLMPGNTLKFLSIENEFEWEPNEYNSLPKFQTVTGSQLVAQLCPGNRLGVKADRDLIAGREREFYMALDQAFDTTMKRLNQTYYKKVINQLLTGAAAVNQGNNAGAAGGGIKLGTVGAPLVINVAQGQDPTSIYRSILDVVVSLESAKSQSDVSGCVGEWRLAVHDELVLNFSYAQSTGNLTNMNDSVMSQGVTTYGNLFGKTTSSSTLMPKINLVNGSFKTPIVLFNTRATAFKGGIASAYKDSEFAADRYLLTETHGGLVLRPAHIFVAWVELRRV